MPKTSMLDRTVYYDVESYLIKERLEKTPVVNTLDNVNRGRVNPLSVEDAVERIQRCASYWVHAGYPAMYVRDRVVFLNS